MRQLALSSMTESKQRPAPIPGPGDQSASLQETADEVRDHAHAVVRDLDALPTEQLATQEAVVMFESAHSMLVRALESVDTV